MNGLAKFCEYVIQYELPYDIQYDIQYEFERRKAYYIDAIDKYSIIVEQECKGIIKACRTLQMIIS